MAGRLAHSRCAASAAESAASRSASVLSGTVQMGWPVEGLVTSIRVLAAGRNELPVDEIVVFLHDSPPDDS